MGVKKSINNMDSLPTDSNNFSNEEAMFRQLGIDDGMIKKLEEASLEDAREKVKISVRYMNNSDNHDLSYKYIDDSGMDLRANLTNSLIIKPSERVLVPTGIHFELPESMEIQVRPRSGLAIKNGVTVLNTPGTVDRGYNGEIKVILINLSKENFTVNHGDRVAQAVISPVVSGRWAKIIKVDSLSDSDRSDGGFGSTGIN
jgi:dUTP pyrophosphatase|tara:strand:+ start:126 stop:728 length:603 start_codon:yes stop_codon:yes gene_type:complete